MRFDIKVARGLIVSLITACLGCGATQHQRILHQTVRSYHQQLRWSLLDEAGTYVAPKLEEKWRQNHLNQKLPIKIVSIERRALGAAAGEPPTAKFEIKIKWYVEGEMKLQESYWRETWRIIDFRWQLIEEKRVKDMTGNGWP